MKKYIVFAFSIINTFCLSSCGKEAASIGIIGGADGPTAIFVTSNMNWLNALGILALIILVALIVYRHKK